VDNFHEGVDSIKLGVLYFDESIGTRGKQENIFLIDRDMFSTEGFVDGKFEQRETEQVKRRVWVRLYPSVETAILAEKGIDEYSISKKKLSKIEKSEKKGFLSKLFT
jgi:hypothetical protein